MLTLGIDTSSPATSIAILEDNDLRALIHEEHEHPPSDAVFATLEALLQRESLTLKQFDVFAAAEGPGSFTGLRIGLGLVKTLAFALKKPVFGIDSVSAAAFNIALELATPEEFGVVIPGFKATTFLGRFKRQAEFIEATEALGYADGEDELVEFCSRGPGPTFHSQPLPWQIPHLESVTVTAAPALAIARLARLRQISGLKPDFDSIQPRYLKPFNIGKKARRPEDLK